MLMKLLATTSVLAIVVAANATVTMSHHLESSGVLTTGDTYEAWRITVDVTDTPPNDPNGYAEGPDDWTATSLTMTDLTGGATWYQDPVNDSNPPNPAFFSYFPDSEWTSYYTSPADYPNVGYDGTIVGIAYLNETSTLLKCDWFDVVDGGTGNFVLAQITVLTPPGAWETDVSLRYAAVNSGGDLFHYSFTIPEPSSLALLALGGLALVRRR